MSTNRSRKISMLIVVFALTFVFLSCATHEKVVTVPEGKQLTHDELINLFSVAREANHTNNRGISTIKYTPDGRQTIAKSDFFDTGKYRIEDDKISISELGVMVWRVLHGSDKKNSLIFHQGMVIGRVSNGFALSFFDTTASIGRKEIDTIPKIKIEDKV